MNTYKLSIFTPYGKTYEGQVQSLIAPGQEGLFGVLASHTPMYNLLRRGLLEFEDEAGVRQFYAIGAGILEVMDAGDVVLLIDNAVKVDNKEINQKEIEELVAV